MIRLYRLLLISTILLSSFLLTTCEPKELNIALNYEEMLEQAYNETGEGRIIPLTIENAVEVDGSVTEDGLYLYYSSNRDRGNNDIYLRSMEDITTVRITDHPSSDYSPAISPNGKYLAYISEKEDPEGDLYVVSVSGSSLISSQKDIKTRVKTRDSSAENISQVIEEGTGMKRVIKDANPSWSPDNKLIAFSSERDGTENIYICQRDGDEMRQLTFNGGKYPSWSPDGSTIVFVSYRDEGNNGDIFTVNVESGSVKQITDTTDVEMYPSFTKTGHEIVYTLFDQDTNEDRKIDLADKSVIQYLQINTGESYPLTFYSVSSFSPRYFPVFPMNYGESEDVNFSGVIVYSQQIGNNIDINLIPEYGVIPKRQSAREQYETAMKYLNEDNDYERYLVAMLRVYYFFGSNRDNVSRIFTSRALKRVALEAYRNGNTTESERMLELLAEESSEGNGDYKSLTVSFLTEVLNGRDGGVVLKEGLDQQEENSPLIPFLLEDLGDYYNTGNTRDTAAEYYARVLHDYPRYVRRQYVNYSLGSINFDADSDIISPQLLEVLKNGSPYQKDEATRFLTRRYLADLTPAARTEKMEHFMQLYQNMDGREYGLVSAMARYIHSATMFSRGDEIVVSRLANSLDDIDTETVLYYSINKLLADIALKDKQKEEEEEYLFEALNSYKSRWNQNDLEEVVLRLIEFYENRGRKFERDNNYRRASSVYKNYTEFLSSLKDKGIKKFDSIYDDYGTRAHVLRIDTYYRYKNYSYESLESLRADYLDGLDRARRSFDKSHIFGLAYVYAQMGYHLDQHFIDDPHLLRVRSGFVPGAEQISPELIAKHFKNSLDTLEWSLYMDDSFSDSYLLKGWIYNYLDVRRAEEVKKQSALGNFYENYFPDYLLESGIDIYERSLETNNELKFPEKEGNIHLNLANTYFSLVNYTQALKHYQAAAKYKTSFASKKQQALFYFHQGYCYYQTGNIEESSTEMKKVEQIYLDLAGGEVNGRYAGNIIQIYKYYALFSRVQDDYRKTIEWYDTILDVAARFNVKIDRARYLQEIAYCYIQLKNYAKGIEFLNRADVLLESYDINDTPKHNVRVKAFQYVRFNIGLSADQTVFGESRLYSEFDTFTKMIYSLTLREMLYKTKGDYNSVISVLEKKLDLIKDNDLKIHNEIRLRTYNNLGNAYFMMGKYQKSEEYFKEAWEYADSIENQNGMFISMGNVTSLYSFLFENKPEYFENSIDTINDFIQDMQSYGDNYEELENEIRFKALQETNEKRGLPEPDVTDRLRIREQVKQDAQEKYYKLEIYQATMNFYKAEELFRQYNTLLQNPRQRNAENIYTYNIQIYDLYASSASIFEKALNNSKTDAPTGIKLMVNASICRERLGQISQAFKFLEMAQKTAEEYRYEDSLMLIYLKEAEFIVHNYEKVGYRKSRAEEYYVKALEIVEFSPQSFVRRIPLVEKLYEGCSTFYLDGKDYARAFSIRERMRRFQLITQIYVESPHFFRAADRTAFDSYKYTVNDIAIQKRRLTEELEKEKKSTPQQVAKIERKLKELNGGLYNSAPLGSLIRNFINFEEEKEPFKAGTDFILYDIYVAGNTVYVWKVKPGSVECVEGDSSTYEGGQNQKYQQCMTELLEGLDEDSSTPAYMIASRQLHDIWAASSATESGDEGGNVSGFTYVYSMYDIPFVERNSRSLLTSGYIVRDDIGVESEERDLLEHSVIIDNVSASEMLSDKLFRADIRPSLIIRNGRDTFNQRRLLYYASIYNGGANILYQNRDEVNSLEEKDNLLAEYSLFGQMNTLPDQKGIDLFGKSGIINPDSADYSSIAENLFNPYQQNMIQGDADEARYYLARWKSAVTGQENSALLYSLNLAAIYAYTDNYTEAVNVINQVQLETVTDSDLRNRIISTRLMYMLYAGDFADVEQSLTALAQITEEAPPEAEPEIVEPDTEVSEGLDGESPQNDEDELVQQDGAAQGEEDAQSAEVSTAEDNLPTADEVVPSSDEPSEEESVTEVAEEEATPPPSVAAVQPFYQTPDYRFFTSFVSNVKSGRPIVNIPGNLLIDTSKAGILAAKFNIISGNGAYAEENIQNSVSKGDLLSPGDLLFVRAIQNSSGTLELNTRFSAISSITEAGSARKIKELYNTAVYNNGRFDAISPYVLYYVMERLPKIYQSSLLNYIAPAETIRDLRNYSSGIDRLVFLQSEGEYYKASGDGEGYIEVLNQQQATAAEFTITPLEITILCAKGKYYAEQQNRGELRSVASDLEEINTNHNLYVTSRLLQAESAIQRENLDDGQEVINSLTLQSGYDRIIKNLLQAEIYIRQLEDGDTGVLESESRRLLEDSFETLESDYYLLETFDRPELFAHVCDLMINYSNKVQDYSYALKLVDIKKQFKFLRAYSYTLRDIPDVAAYKSLGADASLEEILQSLSVDDRLYFTGFVPSLNEIETLVPQGEAVISIARVSDDICAWIISGEGIRLVTLENGYSVYRDLNISYQNLLSGVQSLSAVSTRMNELFANVIQTMASYEKVSLVLDSSLDKLIIEYMGSDELIIENKGIQYLPTVSTLLLNERSVEETSLVVLVPGRESVNDRLELLAIRESGFPYTVTRTAESLSSGQNLHIQMPIHYDTVSGKTVLTSKPYEQSIENARIVYVSTNNLNLHENNLFVMANMMKGVQSIILNDTAIRDVNSAVIIREFYSSLLNSNEPFDAFTGARKKLYNNSLYSHPSYWSYTRFFSR